MSIEHPGPKRKLHIIFDGKRLCGRSFLDVTEWQISVTELLADYYPKYISQYDQCKRCFKDKRLPLLLLTKVDL